MRFGVIDSSIELRIPFVSLGFSRGVETLCAFSVGASEQAAAHRPRRIPPCSPTATRLARPPILWETKPASPFADFAACLGSTRHRHRLHPLQAASDAN